MVLSSNRKKPGFSIHDVLIGRLEKSDFYCRRKFTSPLPLNQYTIGPERHCEEAEGRRGNLPSTRTEILRSLALTQNDTSVVNFFQGPCHAQNPHPQRRSGPLCQDWRSRGRGRL